MIKRYLPPALFDSIVLKPAFVKFAFSQLRSLAVVLLTLLTIESTVAVEVRFFEVPGPVDVQYLGSSGDLSADGRTLLIDYRVTNGDQKTLAFSIGQTIEPLSLNIVGSLYAISGDGSFFAGEFGGLPTAARWRADGNRTTFPVPSGSYAQGLSYDGQVVVGSLGSGTSALEAFRWSQQNGVQYLGDLQGRSRLKGNTSVFSQAKGVSGDGSVVIGDSNAGSGLAGFYWSNVTGMISIGDIPGGRTQSLADGVSGDGKTVVGGSWDDFGGQAVRWTITEGLVPLTHGPGFGRAVDASYDGSMIVGLHNEDAVIWDNGTIRTIRSILEEHEIDITGWQLENAGAISDDGRVIAGRGVNPNGKPVAWVIVIVPEPSTFITGTIAVCAIFGVSFRTTERREKKLKRFQEPLLVLRHC